MKLNTPLTRGVLVERYKRFFADVKLDDGTIVTAHCANSGSMLSVKEPGSTVWISPNQNPKAKLDWRWEMIEVEGVKVGINTMHPNRIVEEAINANKIKELTGYTTLRREVKYGSENSRIDLLLEDPGLCYVEVKNVTLVEGERALFPDAVTERGLKHLQELTRMVAQGHRGVLCFVLQRSDGKFISPADHIDPAYGKGLRQAISQGVEILGYRAKVTHVHAYHRVGSDIGDLDVGELNSLLMACERKHADYDRDSR